MKSDDSDPLRSTPKRIADELDAVGLVLAKLCIRVRRLAPFVGFADLKALGTLLGDASAEAVDLSSAVRVGTIRLATPLVDRSPAAADWPLIEKIESNRKPLFDGLAERLAALAERLAALDRQELEHADAQADLERQAAAFEPIEESDLARNARALNALTPAEIRAGVDPDGPRNGLVELPDERRKAADASWEQNEEAHRYLGRAAEPKVEAAACNRCNEVRPLAVNPCPKCSCPEYRVVKVLPIELARYAEPSTPSRRESAMKAAETRRQNRQRELDDLAAVAMRNQAQPEPDVIDRDFERVLEAESDANAEEVEWEPAERPDGSPVTAPKTIALPSDAEERKARKREADRKYQAAKKAKRDLAKAIGNPVEGDGSPLPPYRGREPVIDRPTAPAKSMGQSQHTWEVYDLSTTPARFLGTVVGVNSTRAVMSAEEQWPKLPARMIEVREKGARSRRPKPAPKPDPDVELADFRRSFERNDEYEQMFVESQPPQPDPEPTSPEPAGAERSRKRSEVAP